MPESMIRVYKYKLKPNKIHKDLLEEQLETQRHLYNAALRLREQMYKYEGVTFGLYDQKKQLITQARAKGFLLHCSTGMCQQTLMRLDRAFQAFFRRVKQGETPGYPKSRRFGEFDTFSFNSHGQGCKFNVADAKHARLYIQHVGDIKVHFYRPLPEGAIIKTLSVTRQADGWFVSLTLNLDVVPREHANTSEVTVCVGLEPIVETSDGRSYPAPAYYRKAQERLADAQRVVSRREKGSLRSRKAVRQLARHHKRVANQRKEWHRLTANRLTAQYGVIRRPDFNIARLVKRPKPQKNPDNPTHYLPNGAGVISETNKAILDNAWGMFFQCLEGAASRTGTRIETYPLAVSPIE